MLQNMLWLGFSIVTLGWILLKLLGKAFDLSLIATWSSSAFSWYISTEKSSTICFENPVDKFLIFSMRELTDFFLHIFHIVRQNFTWVAMIALDIIWMSTNVHTFMFLKNLFIFIPNNSSSVPIPFEITLITTGKFNSSRWRHLMSQIFLKIFQNFNLD